MSTEILLADYHNPDHAAAIVRLLNDYALDPMGGGKALSQTTLDNLPATLARYPTAFTLLAFVDGEAAGLINGFESLSTFACKPLLNLHDIAVSSAFRRRGLCAQMLDAVQALALERGCCKLTLEVLQGNGPARAAYQAFGFAGYELDKAAGKASFWEKKL